MAVYRIIYNDTDNGTEKHSSFDEAVKIASDRKTRHNHSSVIVKEEIIWSSDTLDEILKEDEL